MDQKKIKRCIDTARKVGCPKDQVDALMSVGYIPLPWQWAFHSTAREADKPDGPVDIGLGGARGPGKGLHNDTEVMSSSGWKKAGDITMKDKLLAPDGTYTKIVGIYPQGVEELFELTFADGATVTTDAVHKWKVYDNKKSVWRVKSTQELIDSGVHQGKTYLWSIPLMNAPAPGNKYTGPDAYISGYIIGNGTMSSNRVIIYTIENEVIELMKDLGWKVYRYEYSTCWMIQSSKGDVFRDIIGRHVGDQKRIPKVLMEAEPLARLAVLQGLMDSDGHCQKNGSCSFKSVSYGLCEDVQYIVRSLGGQATIHKKMRKKISKGNRDHVYQVNIMHANAFNPFHLKRKADRVKKMKGIRRSIRSIKKVNDGPATCFEVEHDSHLFVVKDFIVTHNSHAVLSQAALDDCQRVEGLKVLFLRQTGVAAKESFEDLVTKVCVGRVAFEQAGHTLRFKNGSRILLGGFKDEKDIDKYIGVEYDIIIIEELNQLTDGKYAKLRGSLRTSKPNWRPRMYTSFNPGGLGHSFVKERYVIPWREGKETTTRFVGSTYKSNPYLNREYIDYLEELGGDLGKAWREGEWDIFAGQYFSEFRYERHVVDPFDIPETWHRFRSIDPSGRSGTTSCHWYAVDQDGTAWVYREHYKSDMDYDEHAIEIKRLSTDQELDVEEEYDYTIIDTSAFAKAGYSETGAEIYERHGVTNLIPASKERVIGWNAVHHYLRWKDSQTGKEFEPKIKIFSTCVNLIRTIPLAIHDEHKPEDVASVWDGAEHGDALDDMRYFLRSLRDRKAPKAESAIEKRLREFQERTSGQGNFNYTRSS